MTIGDDYIIKWHISKRKKEEIFNKISLFAFSIIGCLAGILLIVIAPKIQLLSNHKSTVKTIGQTIISISFSSLLLEWFGYVNYTRKRMCEILAEDEVIKVLDLKRKKELKSALIQDIYMPGKHIDENTIVNVIDKELDNILSDYYYEEFIYYIDCTKIEKNNTAYIQKDIRITFTAKTLKKKKVIFDSLISTYLEPIDIDEELKPLKLRKLIINNADYTKKFKDEISNKENSANLKDIYSRYYCLDKSNKELAKIMTFKDRIYVDMEYSTIVNIDDLVFSHQIDRACKHYCIHFNADNNDFDLLIEGFGFMSLGKHDKERIVKTNNGYMLRFLNWILPGDGAIVVLKNKN